MANDTNVILTCNVDKCKIQVNADFRFANAEWMCSVGLMNQVSQDPTIIIFYTG